MKHPEEIELTTDNTSETLAPNPEDGARWVSHRIIGWLPGAAEGAVMTPGELDGQRGVVIKDEEFGDTFVAKGLPIEGMQPTSADEIQLATKVICIDLNEDGDEPDLALMVYPRAYVEPKPRKPVGLESLHVLKQIKQATRGRHSLKNHRWDD